MRRYEIRLSGEGGQGLVLAGAILAEAAGILGGKHVTYTQSYGPESRGGSCRSDLVVSDDPVDYPICSRLDLLLALTQKAHDAYHSQLKPGGLLIVDQNRVALPSTDLVRVCSLPILETARLKLCREIVANMVCVGIVGRLSGLVGDEDLRRALLTRVPRGTEALNQRALEAGLQLAAGWQQNTRAGTGASAVVPSEARQGEGPGFPMRR
jgi:2-oxoglutarate ferredoxin oxidoreductase subunit gamma